MKTKTIFLILFALIFLIGCSCKKENNNNDAEQPIIQPQYIYGTWEAHYYCGIFSTCHMKLVFNNDSIYLDYYKTDYSGDWIRCCGIDTLKFYFKNDSLFFENCINMPPRPFWGYKLYYLYNNKMITQYPDGGEDTKIEYHKVN